MTKSQDFYRLQKLATLQLDAKLAALTCAGRSRQASLDQLAGLAIPVGLSTELSDLVNRRTEMTYQRWAERRRAEINLSLARQTADWLNAQESARQAFGQTQALKSIARRMATKR